MWCALVAAAATAYSDSPRISRGSAVNLAGEMKAREILYYTFLYYFTLVSSCSVPAKILASHLVKLEIERSVEVSEPEQDLGGDLGMGPAL